MPLDGFFGGVKEELEAFLDGKTANGGNDGVAGVLKIGDVLIGIVVVLVIGIEIGIVERIVDDVDFGEWDLVLFVDEALGELGDSDDAVGEH